MSTEAKEIVKRFFDELWNQRRTEIADELFAADCLTHQLQSGVDDVAMLRNPEAIKHHIADWLAAFPDLQLEVEQMVAENDYVSSRCVAQGTHTGDWCGIAATGKQVSIRMNVVHRIRDGKIAEDWVLVESLGFFQQLGLLPATAEILTNKEQRY